MLIPIHKKGMAGKPQSESSVVISGPDIFIPAGNYKDDVNKSVEIVEQAVPSIEIDNNGLITTEVSQIEGYVEEGIKSNTKQLTTQAAKTITPTTSEQTAVSAGVYTTGAIKVNPIPSNYITTTDATAAAGDILSGKTAYVNGSKVTGSIASKSSNDLSASGATVNVPAGYYASQVSKSVVTATQATPSISVSSAGLITASAIQSAGYVDAGTKSATSQLTTQAAQTITPGTSNKTIASGRYLTGTQTIKGDANLVASNIKSGVSIFGVAGNCLSMNVNIVGGTTQPNSPLENTLWVNTSTTITKWSFDSATPTNAISGMVWIKTTSTGIGVNVAQGNSLYVYPISAFQYNGSSWNAIPIYLYKNNKWISFFDGYFYNNGQLTTACNSSSYVSPSGSSVTFNSSDITCSTRGGYASEAYVVFGPFDLSSYTMLSMSATATAINEGDFYATLYVATNANTPYTSAAAITNNRSFISQGATGSLSATLNVSSLSGAYYIYAGTNTGGVGWGTQRNVKVKQVRAV